MTDEKTTAPYDPLFDHCVSSSKGENANIGMRDFSDISGMIKKISDTEQPAKEMKIAITPEGKVIISGNDQPLIEHLKTIGITPTKGKIDLCG
jgi:hypothetical protein